MKRFLAALAVTLTIAAAVIAAEQWNPHHGLNHLFVSNWDHKDPNIIRYQFPQAIGDTTDTIQYLNATSGNLDRPVSSHVTPVLRDALNPLDHNSWRFVEDWRLECRPQTNSPPKYQLQFNVEDVSQWIAHYGAKDGKPDTYADFVNFNGRDSISVCKGLSQINYAAFGAEKIKVYGSGKIELGPAVVLDPSGVLVLAAPFVTDKDGVKYLKTAHNGVKYGIKLEKLDW